jgi:hypothetical protein
MAQKNDDDRRGLEDEIARQRLAAEQALGQLEWCVAYLHRIRESRIAEVIDRNRRHIRRQMGQSGG